MTVDVPGADERKPRPVESGPPDRDRSTVDVALDAVEKAAGALERLVRKERRRRRLSTALLAGLLVFGGWNYQHDKQQSCQSANNSRGELHAAIQFFVDRLVPDGSPPELVVEKDAFMVDFKAGLPIRECSFF